MEGGPDSSHGQGGALFLFVALLLFGCTGRYQAQSFDPESFIRVPHPPAPSLEESLQTAILARERGRHEEALEILSLLRIHNQNSPEATYQLAIALEEAQLYSQAVGLYREIVGSPSSERRNDAAFREALCLWQLHEDRAAARALKRVAPAGALELSDRYKLDLAMGVNWLRTGRPRRGEQRIIETLNATDESGRVQFMRALAVHALMEHTLSKAARLNLQVREKHQFRDLQARVALLREAEDHLRRIMQLSEIHWMLQGWLALGDAYMAFADDLSAAPAPRDLTTAQETRYRSGLADQALALKQKGLRSYDRGVEVAVRAGRQDLKAAQLLESRLSNSMTPNF